MPYYDYRCPAHGVFEMRRPMDSADSAPCPQCSGSAERMLSAPYIAGSGSSDVNPYCEPQGCATPMAGGCGMGGCGHVH